jgi:hypothetical protein
MPQVLRHRTTRQLVNVLSQAALYASLLVYLSWRLPPWAIAGAALLVAWDVGSTVLRTARVLRRVRRLGVPPLALTRKPRCLPLAWALTMAWMWLATIGLVWRLAYLGRPFLPLLMPDALTLAGGACIGALGAGLLWLLACLRRPGPALPLPARWDERLLLAALSAGAGELFLRGALQPTLGWPLTALFAGVAYVALFWRARRPAWGVVAALCSAALGGLFELTGNLWGPVLGHLIVVTYVVGRVSEPGRLPW